MIGVYRAVSRIAETGGYAAIRDTPIADSREVSGDH